MANRRRDIKGRVLHKSRFLVLAVCIGAPLAFAAGPQALPSASSAPPAQQIIRVGEQAPSYGSIENFSGSVRVDPIIYDACLDALT